MAINVTRNSPVNTTSPEFTKRPEKAFNHPDKKAADDVGNFMSAALQQNTHYTVENWKKISEGASFTTPNGPVTLPKELQEQLKTLLSNGSLAQIDDDGNGSFAISELWRFAYSV